MTENTLLSVEDVVVDLPTPRGNLRAVDRVEPHRRRRPDARRGRRIRLRQDHAVAGDPAIAAEEGKALRPRDVRRAGPAAARAGETAQAARPLAGGRVPGPDDLAQSGAHDRHPTDRDAAGTSGTRRRHRQEAQRRTARRGRHSRARAAAGAISPPALRRHAAARGDRDRAVVRTKAADRRRADHRARRDDPGADPRSPGARAAPPAHGDDPDHPRPRRRRRPHRRSRRDVCRPRGRARADAGLVQENADALYRSAARSPSAARRRAAHAAAGDLRASARSDPAAAGLLVLAALPLCGGPLPGREAAH